jgi:CHASE3 domain sensor protein
VKLQSNKSLYLLSLGFFILLCAWGSLFWRVRGLRAEYKEVAAPLSEESGKESYVTKVSRQLRETEVLQAKLEALVVDKGNEAFFLEKIEGLGTISGTVLRISDFEERGGVLRIAVKSLGTFSNVYYFMRCHH